MKDGDLYKKSVVEFLQNYIYLHNYLVFIFYHSLVWKAGLIFIKVYMILNHLYDVLWYWNWIAFFCRANESEKLFGCVNSSCPVRNADDMYCSILERKPPEDNRLDGNISFLITIYEFWNLAVNVEGMGLRLVFVHFGITARTLFPWRISSKKRSLSREYNYKEYFHTPYFPNSLSEYSMCAQLQIHALCLIRTCKLPTQFIGRKVRWIQISYPNSELETSLIQRIDAVVWSRNVQLLTTD